VSKGNDSHKSGSSTGQAGSEAGSSEQIGSGLAEHGR
jgi:hypothetical protein